MTSLPSNKEQTTRECVYSGTYDQPINIHMTLMASYNRHGYDTWNFPSSCLLATPQWRNALAGVAVVVKLSPKHRGGRITFHVFCSCDRDLDPMTFV